MSRRNKSSIRLENKRLDQLPAHDRLLVLLKRAGPATTADLAAKLGITGEAARQQLLRLQEQGLVGATLEVRGRGRPVQRWQLTVAANRRFPDSHAELAAQLIRAIRKVLGEPALDRLVEAREAELRSTYTVALRSISRLGDRIRRLASIRNAEGYMAEWRAEKGGYLFIQNHCPICAASGVCLELCRAELALLSELLGPGVVVHREEHLVAGGRRCVYRIEPRARWARRIRGARA